MTKRTNWRLLAYSLSGSKPRPGLLVDGHVVDIGRGTSIDASSTMEILEEWDDIIEKLDATAAAGVPADAPLLEDVTLHAPVPRPNGIFCASSNYSDHVAEMSAKKMVPKESTWGPYVFLKTPHAIADPNTDVFPPARSEQLDWEVEIGVVIGKGGKGISVEDAYQHVAGYVIVNDLSARDLDRRGVFMPFGIDTLLSKSFDNALPMGPWLTPAGAIEDPMNLDLKLWVGEELMQNSSTKWMYYSIAEQISFLSESITLRPGDIIATGTPAGVGFGRGRFLQDGEVVVVEIEGLGTLTNTVRTQ